MTDLLGEALAQYDRTGYFLKKERDTVVAAARNWHTLTNPSDELIERVAGLLSTIDIWPAKHHPEAMRPWAEQVVDALTDTAEPE